MPNYSKRKAPSISKQELSYLPFSELANVPVDTLELRVKELGLADYSSWMLPQIFGLFSRFKVYKNDDNMYMAEPFLEHNIGKDPHLRGIWKVCARLKRGALVKGQNTTQGAKYSALVPLILASIKEAQGIPYSQWTNDSIPKLVDRMLQEAMLVDPNDVPDLSVNRILEIRRQGLTTMSGSSMGQLVKATSKWSLTGIKDTELGHLPTHAVTMICQTWVAHPTLRHPLMILDPNDWDTMPKPLIDSEVITAPSGGSRSSPKMFFNPTVDENADPWA